jgi:protein involved in polysaccharide export with SLBB domain
MNIMFYPGKLASFCIRSLGALTLASSVGCHAITDVHQAIPASRLPCELCTEPREGRTVFPLTALGQDKPLAHTIGPGDQLGVYVFGVMPPGTEETLVLQRTQPVNQRYYPPHGSSIGASTGLPVEVDHTGSVDLPLIGKIELTGLTIPEATDVIKQAYREKQITKQDSERVQVSLITARVHRVIVLREDTPSTPVALVKPGQVDHIHRGSADVVDLPAYENDLLHALAVTGGLPGTDAAREIWIFKRSGLTDPHAICPQELQVRTASYRGGGECDNQVIRIPLTGCPGEGYLSDNATFNWITATSSTCRDVKNTSMSVAWLLEPESQCHAMRTST